MQGAEATHASCPGSSLHSACRKQLLPVVRVCLLVQPIYWEYDHALYVYPLPDALVLADDAPAASFEFDSCSCINPVRAGGPPLHSVTPARRAGLPACCLPCRVAPCAPGGRLQTPLMPCLTHGAPGVDAVQGSLACGTFAAYSPVTREAEMCDVQPLAGDEAEEEEEAPGAGGMEMEVTVAAMVEAAA